MNVFVFDIETVPDVASGRELNQLSDLGDEDVASAMAKRSIDKSGNDFLPLYLHRIVAISAVFRSSRGIHVWSLGDEEADEPELIQRFFEGVEKYGPTLISWNGTGFDLPVLHYRSLLHGIPAPKYWETGEHESAFKWNNYLNRYHYRHLDLMDVLSGYQLRAAAPLDQIACMLGFPGKMGMSGGQVWSSFLQGDIQGIRNYCETDVLNTYLVYLRFQLIRSQLLQEDYEQEIQHVRTYLSNSDQQHFQEFLSAWHE